jgi:hypothetical protein
VQMTAEAPRLWARPLVLVPVFALVSLVGARFPAFSPGANMVVLGAGGVLFWLAFADRPASRGIPRPLAGRARWWLVPVVLMTGIELVNFALGPRYDHPTLSSLADPYLVGYLARAAAYFGWLAGYWALVRR